MMHIAVQSTPRHKKADVDRDEEKKTFQVKEHELFQFSKPLLVIIHDLETNHECLCLD